MKTIRRLVICLVIAAAFLFADVVVPSVATPFAAEVSAAQTVKINKKKLTLYRKQSATLKITGTSKKMTWSSSNKSVAKVSSKGKVTALKKGTATITAKVGGKKYTCKVTVKNPTISASKATINIGGKKTLTVKHAVGTVTWSTNNSTVATVSKKGVVTGKKNGTATITAKASGIKLTCKITVRKPSLSEASVTLKAGQTKQLTVNNFSGSAVWSSDNTAAAEVSGEGLVTAKASGQAVITAKAGAVTLTCLVTVESNTSDKVYTLKVANSEPAGSLSEAYLETLCSQMTQASGGRLQFEFYSGGILCSPYDTLDVIKLGGADIGWATTIINNGRFPIADFLNLCGNGIKGARFGADVFQQMYEEIPELRDEFAEWKVLALYTNGYAPICTKGKKIETPADFGGLIIRTTGTSQPQLFNALGANAVMMSMMELYGALTKGAIEGMASDFNSIDTLKLYEPIDYCLDYPVNHTARVMVMNKDLYESMDDELKAVIDSFSTGYAGEMAGYWWDSCNFSVQETMRNNGVEIVTPSADMVGFLTSDTVLAPIRQSYIDSLNNMGLNGQAIYDKCMAIVAGKAAAHANDWSAPFSYTDWNKTPADYPQMSGNADFISDFIIEE